MIDGRPYAVLILLILAVVTATAFAAPVTGASDALDVANIDAPSEVSTGEEIEIESSVTIPNAAADYTADVEFRLYVDDEQVGTQEVFVEDGDSVDVSVEHEFQGIGENEVRFEIVGEIEREGPARTQTSDVERETPTLTVDVTPEQVTTDGAAFTAPEPIQDDIDEVRDEIPEVIQDETNVGDSANAFVLTSDDELFVVLTDEEPEEGYASVEGFSPRNVVETDEFDFGVIVAEDVEFRSPTVASVEDVYQDAENYDREYVEINAHHRYVAIDYESRSSATAGVLVADPLDTDELFESVGSNSRAALEDPEGDNIESVLGEVSQDRIVTTSSETEYWTDGEVTINGITAAPDTPARDFIETYNQDNIIPADSSTPVMYVIDEEYSAQEVSSISEISENADRFDGDLVSVESNLLQTTISTERVFQSATGTTLPVDTILHGGAAWDQVPETRDEVVLVMAASSVEQQQYSETREGKYQITGEVVSTDRIEGNLPDGSILIAYDLERTGELDTGANELIETQASGVSDTLENQADPEIDATEMEDTGGEVDGTDDVEGAGDEVDETEEVEDSDVEDADGEVEEAEPEIEETEPDTRTETEVESITDEEADQESVAVHRADQSNSVQEIRFGDGFDGATTVEEYHDRDLLSTTGESIEHAVNAEIEDNEETVVDVNVATLTRISPDDPNREATVVMSVDSEAIDDPENASIYHEKDDSWEELTTEVEEVTDDEIVLSGETDGFSMFAVAEVETESSEATDSGFPVLGFIIGISGIIFIIAIIIAPIAILILALIFLKRRFIG